MHWMNAPRSGSYPVVPTVPSTSRSTVDDGGSGCRPWLPGRSSSTPRNRITLLEQVRGAPGRTRLPGEIVRPGWHGRLGEAGRLSASLRPKRQPPVLPHEILAEGMMWLLLHQPEAGRLVDAPRRGENVVSPKDQRVVSRVAGEADAFANEAPADAEAARLGFDVQEPQLGNVVGIADEEDGADHLPFSLGDPATLAPAVEFTDELTG